MKPFRARVIRGRIRLDEPTDLPEGTILELVHAETLDNLDEEEQRALQDLIERSFGDKRLGRVFPACEVLAELRRQRP